MSNWTLWQKGTKREKAAAKSLLCKFRKYNGRYYVRYYVSPIHKRANRKDNSRSHKAGVDELFQQVVRDYLDEKPIGNSRAYTDSDELTQVKKLLADAGITHSPFMFTKQALADRVFDKSTIKEVEVEAAIKDFINFKCDDGRKLSTQASARITLRDVFKPFYGTSLCRVAPADILASLSELWRTKDWSVGTYNKRVFYTNAILKWGIAQEPSIVNPDWPLGKLATKSKSRDDSFRVAQSKYFTPDQTSDILYAAGGFDTHLYQFDYTPCLALQFFGACRPSESYNVQWGNMDFNENTIKVGKNKFGGDIRMVRMKPNLKNILLPYYERSKGRGSVLPRELDKKLNPLYQLVRKQIETKGRSKRSDELKFEKMFLHVQLTCAQAYGRIAKRNNIKWIKDGSRHSYGSYRYRELFQHDATGLGETAKSTLKEEMGTSLSMLNKHYIGAKGLGMKEVECYFKIGL